MPEVAGSTPVVRSKTDGAISSDGRASRFERDRRGFESCMALHFLVRAWCNWQHARLPTLSRPFEAGRSPQARAKLETCRNFSCPCSSNRPERSPGTAEVASSILATGFQGYQACTCSQDRKGVGLQTQSSPVRIRPRASISKQTTRGGFSLAAA